jgi:hypothetical protein
MPMLRLSHVCAALAMLTVPATPAAEAQVNDICREFGAAEVIFVGRVKSEPITRRISGEQEIEKALVVSDAAERDLKAFEALRMPPEIGGGRHLDLTIRAVKAREEYNRTRARYPPPFDLSLIPVSVEMPFRGVKPGELFVLNRGLPQLDPSRSYVIYAVREMNFLAPDVITLRRAVDLESADAHLQFLNDTANDSGTLVHGSVTLDNPDAPQPRAPLAGIVLRVSLGDQRIEMTTGADGSFLLPGVPHGLLKIEPVLPDYLTLPPQSLGGESRGGCMDLHLRVVVNGRVRGRVLLDNGEPFRGLVDVIGDTPTRRHFGTAPAFTNDRGEFSFSALPPGRYLIGVNIARQPTASTPFRPTYFPGVTDRSQATPVVVGLGTEQAELEWVVNARLRVGSIDASFETRGQPQKEMGVCVTEFDADLRDNGGGGYGPRPNGLVTIPIVEGVRYRLAAYAQLPSGFAESEIVDIIGAPGRQVLKLQLASVSDKATGIRCPSSKAPFSPSR